MPADSNLENKFQVRWQLFVAICALVAVNALWGLSFPIIKSMNLQMEHAAGLESSQIDSSLRVAFTAGMIAMRFAIAFLLLCFCFTRGGEAPFDHQESMKHRWRLYSRFNSCSNTLAL